MVRVISKRVPWWAVFSSKTGIEVPPVETIASATSASPYAVVREAYPSLRARNDIYWIVVQCSHRDSDHLCLSD